MVVFDTWNEKAKSCLAIIHSDSDSELRENGQVNMWNGRWFSVDFAEKALLMFTKSTSSVMVLEVSTRDKLWYSTSFVGPQHTEPDSQMPWIKRVDVHAPAGL